MSNSDRDSLTPLETFSMTLAARAQPTLVRRFSLLAAAAVLVAMSQSGALPVAASSTNGDGSCSTPWRQTTVLPQSSDVTSVLSFGQADAWAVGSQTGPSGTPPRMALAEHWDGTGWTEVPTAALNKGDSGLRAIAGATPQNIWAVGYAGTPGVARPLVERWNGSSWAASNLPAPALGAGSLESVAIFKGRPWIAGYIVGPNSSHLPYVARWSGSTWINRSPVLKPEATVMSLSADNGILWATGYTTSGGRNSAFILRWSGTGWVNTSRAASQPIGSVLTDLAFAVDGSGWAVGYRNDGISVAPLVERWDGTAWSVSVLKMPSSVALLTAVSAASTGVAWIVGTEYDSSAGRFVGTAAQWDGSAWQFEPIGGPVDARSAIEGLAGALDFDGWAVGRAGSNGLLTQACAVAPTVAGSNSLVRGFDVSERQRVRSGVEMDDQGVPSSHVTPGGAPGAQSVEPLGGVVARDVAVDAGINISSTTHGATVGDFDGNGWSDVFVSGHGSPGHLLLNDGGQFTEKLALTFRGVDRHDCAAADVNRDGALDLYCSQGGARGTAVRSNELWLDPSTGTANNVAVAWHAVDPVGRGRTVTFLDANQDGFPDMFLGDEPQRVDGLPSTSGLWMNLAGTGFRAEIGGAIDTAMGARCAHTVDIDGNSWPDLLLCTADESSPNSPRLRLMRNVGGRFVDATRELGVSSISENDAAMVDLNGDGRQDLIQLGTSRIKVSLSTGSAFQTVYDLATSSAIAVAAGDVNGDGRPDIYVVRSGVPNRADVLLINNGTGTNFSSVAIPQTTVGSGEAVVPLDYDGNGLTDFLVLNGNDTPGPVQLIAFFPATPF